MSKIVFACKQYDCICRKYKRIGKLLELMRKFRKDAIYKLSIYYYISATTQLENSIKKKLICISNKGRENIKIPQNETNKLFKTLWRTL